MSQPTRYTMLASLLIGLAVADNSAAQSASANIAGQAAAGDVAIIQNIDTGFKREVKVKDSGRYQLRSLPTGSFTVTIRHPDGSLEPSRSVTLRVGSTARVQ